jgi:hypothetical protein
LYSQVSRAGLNEEAADTANVQIIKVKRKQKRGFIVAIVEVVI